MVMIMVLVPPPRDNLNIHIYTYIFILPLFIQSIHVIFYPQLFIINSSLRKRKEGTISNSKFFVFLRSFPGPK